MKNQYGFRKLNIIIIVLAIIAAFSTQSYATVRGERYKNAILQKLTAQLRNDLSDNAVEVKLNDVQDKEVSKTQIDFDGKALAVVRNDNTELPLQFTAKVNLKNQSIENISYEFVEAKADFAPTLTEESLMKDLMGKISKDYKTTNIVIAIDGFDAAKAASTKMNYQGTGEVRIGDFEWKRINFSVVLDSKSQLPTQISYDVQNK